MSSVVFFGRAHAGKSTLVGSMIAREKGLSYKDLLRLERKNFEEIPNYDPSSLYASIVDDTRIERSRRGRLTAAGHAPGSTQKRHYRTASRPNGDKITLIDTPGAEHRHRERDRGMFAGDVGVFCIEAADVIKEEFFSRESQYRTLLRTLSLWAGLSHTKVIVALTKMDEADFRQEVFEEAIIALRLLTDPLGLGLEFVPTAVDVAAMRTFNVFKKSQGTFSWYNGPSLSECIETQLEEIKSNSADEFQLLFTVDESFKKPRSNVGQTWRIKVLSGTLEVGDAVTFGPVMNDRGEYFPVKAKVKALRGDLHRSDQTVELTAVSFGQIAGLDLQSIRTLEGRNISKSSVTTVSSSCGFSCRDSFKIGDSFKFTVARSEKDAFIPGRELLVMWFGRALPFRVSEVGDEGDTMQVIYNKLSKPIIGEIASGL